MESVYIDAKSSSVQINSNNKHLKYPCRWSESQVGIPASSNFQVCSVKQMKRNCLYNMMIDQCVTESNYCDGSTPTCPNKINHTVHSYITCGFCTVSGPWTLYQSGSQTALWLSGPNLTIDPFAKSPQLARGAQNQSVTTARPHVFI